MPFGVEIALWQGFYATVAGLAGTLVGLLFVGLGLNPRIIARRGPSGMRVLAAQTFHSFVFVLVLAMVAQMPGISARTFAVVLAFLGLEGLLRVGHDVRQARRDPDPHWASVRALLRYLLPTLAYGITVWLALDVWDGSSGALSWLVAVIVFLTLTAASNCWDLLQAIGDQADTAGGSRRWETGDR